MRVCHRRAIDRPNNSNHSSTQRCLLMEMKLKVSFFFFRNTMPIRFTGMARETTVPTLRCVARQPCKAHARTVPFHACTHRSTKAA